MDKKVVLITGCSSGIGLSLAVRLASDPDKNYKGTDCVLDPLEPPSGRIAFLLHTDPSSHVYINATLPAVPVYATMRNLAKKERLLESVKGLHKDTLDILQMDVTSLQSILDAKERVAEKRMDILGKTMRIDSRLRRSDLGNTLVLLMGSVQCRCGPDGAAGGAVPGLHQAHHGGQSPGHHPDHPGFPPGHEGPRQRPHPGHRQHRWASR